MNSFSPGAPLDFAYVDVVGAPFLVIWSPEDAAVRAGGFAATVAVAAAATPPATQPSTPAITRLTTPTSPAAQSYARASALADPLWERLALSDPETAARGLAAVPAETHDVARSLGAYAAGELGALDGIRVMQRESPFKAEVWRALRALPGGSPVTYTELAALAGRPRAVRAAASGCATNLVALIVPCHRIVRTDGGLGGYLFGTSIKQRLLDHERAHA